MTKLAWFFSILTFVFLGLDLINDGSESTQRDNQSNQTELVEPSPVITELLKVEEEWLALQSEFDAKRAVDAERKNNSLTEVDKSKFIKVGEDNYQLLGIFVDDTAPFILLKPLTASTKDKKATKNVERQSGIIKVFKGQELSPGIVLTELTSRTIILQGTDETFEFKLFERSNNESS